MPHEVGSPENQALREQAQHPHAATIQGLRDAADWLTQHPELPAVHHINVSFGWGITTLDAREKLTLVAKALGARAEERHNYPDEVTIGGYIGAVHVTANAKNRALLDVPVPEPIPAPIIPAKEDVDDA